MTLQADFTSQDYYRNPAAAIDKLRALGPVVQVRFPMLGTVWATTTQALADQVLKDTATFTIREEDGTVAGLRWWMPRIVRTLANSMLSMDEPDHKRLRDIVDEAFRRRAVLDMEPHIRAIGDQLADELFAEGSPADLVDRYARKLPLSVICELLGLPLADRAKFAAWAGGFTRFTGALGFFAMLPNAMAMKRYIEQHLETVRQKGGEGLIAEIVRVEKEGGQISRDEIVSMVFLLLFAGHETTTHLISGGVHELLKNPGLRDWLEEDWSRADLAVEEFLRFITPVQFTKPRYVRRDVDLGGVKVKKGEKVMAMLAAANMDSAGQSPSGTARPAATAEPAHRLRHRNPFLPRPSARAPRGQMRAEILISALAATGAWDRRVRNHLAQAARHQGHRSPAGRRRREAAGSRGRGGGCGVIGLSTWRARTKRSRRRSVRRSVRSARTRRNRGPPAPA